MSSHKTTTVDQIENTGRLLREKRPFLKELISFYESLFTLQEQQRQAVKINSLSRMDAQTVKEKQENGFPIVSKEDFEFPMEEVRPFFEKILSLCLKSESPLRETAQALSDLVREGKADFESLARHYIQGNPFEPVKKLDETHRDHIEFIVYNALKPWAVEYSQALTEMYPADSVNTENRVCPVCGEAPAFSVLSENGARSLTCGFCWHEWPVRRIFCPYCDTRESDSLSYLYIEGEKQIRADLCENCMRYIKSVDAREISTDFYMPLEIVSSVPLDIKAAERK
ncbi:MAG: formate dehydrogenase accessory protein FdhE [Desulfobacteraceae bacterium]